MRISSPSTSPNSNFVSAMMSPRVAAYSAAAVYSSTATVEILSYSSWPMSAAAAGG